MKNTTLVIMAAGIGSRFGGGIKQLEPMGPNGEIITPFMMRRPQVLTKWFLFLERILKKIFAGSLARELRR